MAAKKIIAVVGATGNQGSSVANTFLELPNWHVRCLTRNTSSNAAKELADKGAEVIQADLNDVSSLTKAFENATAIFVNTDFWQTWRPAKAALDAEGKSYEAASAEAFKVETTHGKNAADAAAAIPSLERFVYSTLPSPSKASGGKYSRSKHLETKQWTVEYIETKQPELAKKTSLIYLGGYANNALLQPRLDKESGKYTFTLPFKSDVKFPVIDPHESTGKFVRALIEDEPAGTRLLAYDTNPTFEEYVEQWSERNGKEAVFVPISVEEMGKKMGLTGEHLDSLAGFNEFGYMGSVEGFIEPCQLGKAN